MPKPHIPGSLRGRVSSASRNGMPAGQPYDLRAGRDAEAARDAEVAETLAALRAKLANGNTRRARPDRVPSPAPVMGAPERCVSCGYLTTARGHLAQCGGPDA